MFISASGGAGGAPDAPMGAQAALASALVSVTWSLGAVARAFEGTRPTDVHDDMIARSRRFADDAAQVIHAFNRGEGFNEPETMLILLELFLLRDVGVSSSDERDQLTGQCGSGDPLWAKTHSLLRTYAQRCGGPRKMVEDNRAVLFGNTLYEQHLVYLAFYDTFGGHHLIYSGIKLTIQRHLALASLHTSLRRRRLANRSGSRRLSRPSRSSSPTLV